MSRRISMPGRRVFGLLMAGALVRQSPVPTETGAADRVHCKIGWIASVDVDCQLDMMSIEFHPGEPEGSCDDEESDNAAVSHHAFQPSREAES